MDHRNGSIMIWKGGEGMRIFALAVLSTVVFALFLGVASAKPPTGGLTVTIYPNFNPVYVPTPTGGQVTCNVNNAGSTQVAKFELAITGGTVSYWYPHDGWSLTQSGNTATWQADSGKWVIGKNSYAAFYLEWTGPYSPGFTANWQAYDKKGNIIDSGTLSWNYP
jgi:hypothetical protein